MKRREFLIWAAVAGCSPRVPLGPDVIVPDGIWTWFNDPRAIVRNGKLIIGSVNSRGIVQVTIDGRTYPVASLGEADDHDNPALLALPDGRLAVFYSRHNDREGLRYRIGSEPEKIIPGNRLTYAKPFLIDGVVRVFSRVDGAHRMASSRDLKHWTVETVLENEGNRPYVVCYQDGGRIHLCMTDGHPNDLPSRIFHGYFEGGKFFRSDGTQVTSRQVRDFTPVSEGWNWQIKCFNGRPEILSIRYPGIDYWHHRGDGKWVGTKLASGQPPLYPGEPQYAGGLCFNGPGRVVMSLFEGGRYELSEWSEGRRLRRITSNSPYHNFRPYSVGSHLLWVSGSYESFTDYRTSILIS